VVSQCGLSVGSLGSGLYWSVSSLVKVVHLVFPLLRTIFHFEHHLAKCVYSSLSAANAVSTLDL